MGTESWKRCIIHCDMNAFFASVEIKLNPSLRGKAMAVCGSVEDRHGIVLAKSEEAKRLGVRTGEAIWEARLKCPNLIICPPQYDEYVRHSHAAREIYARYTNQVESFGPDECWLDVTGSQGLFGDGIILADRLRSEIRNELGLTISAGVSFNKIFAKLGSDMLKPDATTVIAPESFKAQIWSKDASILLGVGPATSRKLKSHAIYTIGDLAMAEPTHLQRLLGVNGLKLWRFANGWDDGQVRVQGYSLPVQSVSHGTTTRRDLYNDDEVWLVLLHLSQDLGHRLRSYGLRAGLVGIYLRDSKLNSYEFQNPLPYPTRSALYLARQAFRLFRERWAWSAPLRSITIRSAKLVPDVEGRQVNIFNDFHNLESLEKVEEVMEGLRDRYGKNIIMPARLMQTAPVSEGPPLGIGPPGAAF